MHFKGVRGNMVDRGHHQPKMEFKLIRPRWSFQCEPFFLKPLGSGFTVRSLKYARNVSMYVANWSYDSFEKIRLTISCSSIPGEVKIS